MAKEFDPYEAKKFLETKEREEKEKREGDRKALLQKVIQILIDEFQGSGVEVFLVGSIIRPYFFYADSDIDIVVKNFQGDRFELWPKLERKIGKSIEIIPFESCNFQDFVLKEGLKVL